MSEPSFWPDAPGARVMMRMGSIGADGDDPGSEPDWHTLEGAKVHLTPSVRVVTFEGIVAPLLDVDGVIDADGYLKTVEGQLPVFVLATDDPRLSTTGWLWSAQIIDHNVTIRFPAPSDGVVNLADYLTAEPSDSTREWVERIPELLEAAGRLDTEAVAAVENAVVNLELVQGRTIPDGTPGLGVSVPFADGSRNALEVDSRGRPTPLSAALHVEAEQGLMGQALGIETRTDLDMPDTAALFVFEDGSIAGHVYRDGTSSFGGGGGTPVTAWPAVAAGDSTTQGVDLADEEAERWSTLLAAQIGRPIENWGRSGHRAEEVAALNGALTATANPTGATIPASGTVRLNNINPHMWRSGREFPPLPAVVLTEDGSVLPGMLNRLGDFTRNTPGDVISSETVEVRTTAPITNKLLFLGAGINNGTDIVAGVQTVDDIKYFYRKVTSRWRGPMVIWGLLDRGESERPGTSRGNYIATMETWFEQEYGDAYAPLRRYLASEQSGQDAQLFDPEFEFTAGDETDLEHGTVPRSYRTINGTSVHLNTLGHQLQARYFHRHLIMRGLI